MEIEDVDLIKKRLNEIANKKKEQRERESKIEEESKKKKEEAKLKARMEEERHKELRRTQEEEKKQLQKQEQELKEILAAAKQRAKVPRKSKSPTKGKPFKRKHAPLTEIPSVEECKSLLQKSREVMYTLEYGEPGHMQAKKNNLYNAADLCAATFKPFGEQFESIESVKLFEDSVTQPSMALCKNVITELSLQFDAMGHYMWKAAMEKASIKKTNDKIRQRATSSTSSMPEVDANIGGQGKEEKVVKEVEDNVFGVSGDEDMFIQPTSPLPDPMELQQDNVDIDTPATFAMGGEDENGGEHVDQATEAETHGSKRKRTSTSMSPTIQPSSTVQDPMELQEDNLVIDAPPTFDTPATFVMGGEDENGREHVDQPTEAETHGSKRKRRSRSMSPTTQTSPVEARTNKRRRTSSFSASSSPTLSKTHKKPSIAATKIVKLRQRGERLERRSRSMSQELPDLPPTNSKVATERNSEVNQTVIMRGDVLTYCNGKVTDERGRDQTDLFINYAHEDWVHESLTRFVELHSLESIFKTTDLAYQRHRMGKMLKTRCTSVMNTLKERKPNLVRSIAREYNLTVTQFEKKMTEKDSHGYTRVTDQMWHLVLAVIDEKLTQLTDITDPSKNEANKRFITPDERERVENGQTLKHQDRIVNVTRKEFLSSVQEFLKPLVQVSPIIPDARGKVHHKGVAVEKHADKLLQKHGRKIPGSNDKHVALKTPSLGGNCIYAAASRGAFKKMYCHGIKAHAIFNAISEEAQTNLEPDYRLGGKPCDQVAVDMCVLNCWSEANVGKFISNVLFMPVFVFTPTLMASGAENDLFRPNRMGLHRHKVAHHAVPLNIMRNSLGHSNINDNPLEYAFDHYSAVVRTKEHEGRLTSLLPDEEDVYPFLGNNFKLTKTPIEMQEVKKEHVRSYMKRAKEAQQALQKEFDKEKQRRIDEENNPPTFQELLEKREKAMKLLLGNDTSDSKHRGSTNPILHGETAPIEDMDTEAFDTQSPAESIVSEPISDTYVTVTIPGTNSKYRVRADSLKTKVEGPSDIDSSMEFSGQDESPNENLSSEESDASLSQEAIEELIHHDETVYIGENDPRTMENLFLLRQDGRPPLEHTPSYVPPGYAQKIDVAHLDDRDARCKGLQRQKGFIDTADTNWKCPTRGHVFLREITDAQGNRTLQRLYPLHPKFNNNVKGAYTPVAPSTLSYRAGQGKSIKELLDKTLTRSESKDVLKGQATYYSHASQESADKRGRCKMTKVRWQAKDGTYDNFMFLLVHGIPPDTDSEEHTSRRDRKGQRLPTLREDTKQEILEVFKQTKSATRTAAHFNAKLPGSQELTGKTMSQKFDLVTVERVKSVVKEDRRKKGEQKGNDSEQCYSVINHFVKTKDTFIREIAMGQGSGQYRTSMSVTVASPEMLEWGARLLASGAADVCIDTTFNVGTRLMSLLTLSHPYVMTKASGTQKKSRTTLFLGAYFHTDLSEDSFVSYLSTMKKNLENAAKTAKVTNDNLFSHFVVNSPTADSDVTHDEFQGPMFTAHADKDLAINNALKRVFGEAVEVLNCSRHTVGNLKRKMQQLKIPQEVAEDYQADLFYRNSAAINAPDAAEAVKVMEDAMQKATRNIEDEMTANAFEEYCQEHVQGTIEEIVTFKAKRSQQMPGCPPILTTNAIESANHSIKKKIQWQQKTTMEMVSYMKEITYAQYNDIPKALYGFGDYKINEAGLKSLRNATKLHYPLTREEWAQLSANKKKKAINALNTFDTSHFVEEQGEPTKKDWITNKDNPLIVPIVKLGKKKNQTTGQVANRTKTFKGKKNKKTNNSIMESEEEE
jgi:hypothetical protein